MEFQGTKGEWKKDPMNSLSIIDGSGDRFHQLIAQANGKSGLEARANLQLITAAPDLLEAINYWLENHNESDPKGSLQATFYRKFKSVRDKAVNPTSNKCLNKA